MKAVILEIRGTFAAALSDDGRVIRVVNRNYAIGQVIQLKKVSFSIHKKVAALTAAVAMLVGMFGVTAWAYCTPYSYVSLDVNPSIEYSVNRFSMVVSVRAVDSDADAILSELKLDNKSIDEAVRETVVQIEQAGYFQSNDPGGIMIATSCANDQNAQKLADDLQNLARLTVKDSSVPVEAVSVGLERVREAQSLGTTPGKLNLVQKLQASVKDSGDINVQEWLQKPVKDIMKAVNSAKAHGKITDALTDGSESSQASSNGIEADSSAGTEKNSSLPQTEEKLRSGGRTVSEAPGKPAAKDKNAGKKQQASSAAGSASSKAAAENPTKPAGSSGQKENQSAKSGTPATQAAGSSGQKGNQSAGSGNTSSKTAGNSGQKGNQATKYHPNGK